MKTFLDLSTTPNDSFFETQFNQYAAQRRLTRTTLEDNDLFGMITGDTNPAHTNIEVARELGFEDTPALGTHTLAYAEQYGTELIRAMEILNGRPIILSGQEIKFKNPLYPSEELRWEVISYRPTPQGLDLSVSGHCSDKTIAEGKLRFSTEFSGCTQREEGIVHNEEFQIDTPFTKEFYTCVKSQVRDSIPMSFPVAHMPSALINLLYQRTGERKGANLAMNVTYHNEPQYGKFQTSVLAPGRSREVKGKHLYKFHINVAQNSTPIVSGEIRCSSPALVDFST
ncbi:MAG: MaoC family dehydratase [Nanoarchaeota archaeon]|nr:MaoC family dehydratase [Nanoarchaeota archaeon]